MKTSSHAVRDIGPVYEKNRLSGTSTAMGSIAAVTALARTILRHRKLVAGFWLVLTLFGAFSASQVSKRWFQSFSIPGYSAYEANQRTLKAFGSGENAPLVPSSTSRATSRRTGASARRSPPPWPRTAGHALELVLHDRQPHYVSKDRHTTFAEIFRRGMPGFGSDSGGDTDAAGAQRGGSGRRPGVRDGPRPARVSGDEGLERRPERSSARR